MISKAQTYVYDFVTNFSTYGAYWNTSYALHTITNEDLGSSEKATFVLSYSNRQISTIKDRPVMASKSSQEEYVTISDWEGTLTEVSFELKQWSKSKKFTKLVIEYTTDGSTWNAACEDLFNGTATVIEDGQVVSSSIPESAISVRLTFLGSTTGNTQVGLTSISLTIK